MFAKANLKKTFRAILGAKQPANDAPESEFMTDGQKRQLRYVKSIARQIYDLIDGTT